MKRVDRFKLHSPTGQGVAKCRLMADGMSTDRLIPGLSLVDQFEVPGGFLLVTDYKDPWDECTELTLLDRQLNTIAHKSLGVGSLVSRRRPFAVSVIELMSDQDALCIKGLNPAEGTYHVEIREHGIPLIKPRIKLQWSADSTSPTEQ